MEMVERKEVEGIRRRSIYQKQYHLESFSQNIHT